jgi:hypothetical protein
MAQLAIEAKKRKRRSGNEPGKPSFSNVISRQPNPRATLPRGETPIATVVISKPLAKARVVVDHDGFARLRPLHSATGPSFADGAANAAITFCNSPM